MNNEELEKLFMRMTPKSRIIPMPTAPYQNISGKTKPWNPEDASRKMLWQTLPILERYKDIGQKMSIRQLHYQHVVSNNYKNTPENDKLLGSVLREARKRGILKIDTFEDRGRSIVNAAFQDNPEEFMDLIFDNYKSDPWHGQEYQPLVLVEKAALSTVMKNACMKRSVPWAAMRGDASLSFMSDIAKWFGEITVHRKPVILYAGDLDPAGWRMVETLQKRMDALSCVPIEIRRVALNVDQIKELNLLPNPVKQQDPNFGKFLREVDLDGESSFELDAIEPTLLVNIISDGIDELVDETIWEEAVQRDKNIRESLRSQFNNETRNLVGPLGKMTEKEWRDHHLHDDDKLDEDGEPQKVSWQEKADALSVRKDYGEE